MKEVGKASVQKKTFGIEKREMLMKSRIFGVSRGVFGTIKE